MALGTAEPHILLGSLGSVLAGLSAAALTFALLGREAPRFPRFGPSGEQRQEGVERSRFFRMIEPLLRFLGGLISRRMFGGLMDKFDQVLGQAGEPWGLCGSELIIISLGSAIGLATIGVMASGNGPGGWIFGLMSGLLGAFSPWLKLSEEGRNRLRRASRELPLAIDLLCLGMNAGMDFLAALREMVRQFSSRGGPLARELGMVLKRIEFGRTKREALLELAARLPCEDVNGFVSSVVQAEERGTPLVEALRIQANMLRTRYGQKAEEAATRAGLLLLGPLCLIFLCVFLVLLGPFIVKALRGGLF